MASSGGGLEVLTHGALWGHFGNMLHLEAFKPLRQLDETGGEYLVPSVRSNQK